MSWWRRPARGFLGGRLTADEGPFEALHLSCHGTIDKERGPVLLLEAAEGGDAAADAGEVIRALGEASAAAGGAVGVPHGRVGRASASIAGARSDAGRGGIAGGRRRGQRLLRAPTG